MKVGQYVLIKFPQSKSPVFARIRNLGEMVMARPIDVVIQKNWGINHLMKIWQGRGSVITMHCPTDAVIPIDWYNDYYLRIYKHDRDRQMPVEYYGKQKEGWSGTSLREPHRTVDFKYVQASEQELMKQTYEMIMMEVEWKNLNTVYDKALEGSRAQRAEERAKALVNERKRAKRMQAHQERARRRVEREQAKIPKKGDLVTVANVRGYRGQKFEMIVAVVGPATLGEGDMIRDLVWDDGNQRIPLTLPASYVGKLSGTQALAFYTKGFPETLIFDIVQWTRTGNQNFIKKEVPPPALTIRKPMQVEEEVDVVEANKIQMLTEQAIRNQEDSKFHKNDIVYHSSYGDVGRGGDDNVSSTTNFVLAVVGPGNYPNGIVVEDVLVNGQLLTLRADYKGKLTRTEGIAFYTEGIFTNPRWIQVNWRRAMAWNRVYKKRTYEPTKLRF